MRRPDTFSEMRMVYATSLPIAMRLRMTVKIIERIIALSGLSIACVSVHHAHGNEKRTYMSKRLFTLEIHLLNGNASSRAKDHNNREVVVNPLIAHDTTSMSVTIAAAVAAPFE